MAVVGQTLAYIRVSSAEQNPARQYEAVGKYDKCFEDRLSGKNAERPELQRMIEFAREGDIVKVASLDRLARSVADLLDIVKTLTTKGVEVQFVDKGLTFKPGNSDPWANFQMTVLAAVAEFEREVIRTRQAEGIAIARTKGKYKGRKPALKPEQIEQARQQIEQGVPKAEVARRLSVSRATLYTALAGNGTYAEAAA